MSRRHIDPRYEHLARALLADIRQRIELIEWLAATFLKKDKQDHG